MFVCPIRRTFWCQAPPVGGADCCIACSAAKELATPTPADNTINSRRLISIAVSPQSLAACVFVPEVWSKPTPNTMERPAKHLVHYAGATKAAIWQDVIVQPGLLCGRPHKESLWNFLLCLSGRAPPQCFASLRVYCVS